MPLHDIFSLLYWWIIILCIGAVFLPLSTRLFPQFLDKGYVFAKVIGIIILSYSVFILGILHLTPFTQLATILILIFFFILFYMSAHRRKGKEGLSLQLHIPQDINHNTMNWIVLEEALFLGGLFFWAYIRGFLPDVHGLEKFMDFGFINAILRSSYFPPHDMWMTPLFINYYYFGHLTTAVLTKLSGVSSQITYNLMLASLFGLTFVSSFSIGSTLFHKIGTKIRHYLLRIILTGLLCAGLVTVAGNLHTMYSFFEPYPNEEPVPIWQLPFSLYNKCYKKESYTILDQKTKKIQQVFCTKEQQESPFAFPNGYWYPNATRFIKNTIHEFPIYSWIVADLHGHVFDIPFVLLVIAISLSFFLSYPTDSFKNDKTFWSQLFMLHTILYRLPVRRPLLYVTTRTTIPIRFLILLGFFLAVLYMTNAWDGIIYLLLIGLLILHLSLIEFFKQKLKTVKKLQPVLLRLIISTAIIGISFAFFVLPFSLFFKPFVSGIGILCLPDSMTGTYGPFLIEKDHCDRSPFWQLATLHGMFYFFVLSFVVFLIRTKEKVRTDFFVIFLIILSTLLITIPEFIYVKDIYPAHYRANTMFKLVFQAFIMLSIASGYIFFRVLTYIRDHKSTYDKRIIPSVMKKFLFTLWLAFCLVQFSLVFTYPYLAIHGYYGVLSEYKGLDGLRYLKDIYPTDYDAILWLQRNIDNKEIILEAKGDRVNGDSYTDYARFSANTGLPTVLGWTVHEWLWRGDYSKISDRVDEIPLLYETKDVKKAESLLKKYNVDLVIVGDLEREQYPTLDEAKFEKLGNIIYQNGKTRIYRVRE